MRLKTLQALILASAAMAPTLLFAAGEPEFKVPLFKKAPVIDGKIGPEEWRSAAEFDGLMNIQSKVLDNRKVRAWVGADQKNIFIAMRTQLPDEGPLLTSVTTDSTKVVFDDSLEVYINPTPDLPDKVDYQFIENSAGKCAYNIHKLGNPKEEESWRGNWKIANVVQDGFWDFECMIPVESMKMADAGRKTTDGVWAVNLTRNWRPDWSWTALSDKGYPNSGLRFVFVDGGTPASGFSVEGCPAFPPAKLVLSAFNPSDKPLQVKASLELTRNNMPAINESKELAVEPGEAGAVEIKLDSNDPTTVFELKATLASPDGKTVFYQRNTKWGKAKEKPKWVTQKPKDAPLVDFQFAYYPSKNAMRICADINGLPKEAKPAKVSAVIRAAGKGDAIKDVDFPVVSFKDGKQEIRLELPPLEGSYEIALTAAGENVPKCETVKTFERKKFPWEGLKDGLGTKIYPPFKPIKVEGNKLSTVLKIHELNDLGLLDQVTATSANTNIAKPILASPIRFLAKSAGSEVALSPEKLKAVSASEHEAVFTGGFSGGPVNASFKDTWDYDGTVKVELTLKPTGGKSIDELILEIPFPAETATMIHANSDRIRAPVAMKIPEGEGVVWDATKVACDEYIRNFCPYAYVGNAVRGLCWFAENDKGWGWNPKTPNMNLSREGGKVVLRIFLINQPTVIERDRTITFGLLAAPVKPPLNKAGEKPDWWRYRYYRDKYSLLGTDINWLALGSCGSVYPAGCDMFLWEMLKRGNQEKLTDADIQKVIDKGKPYFEPYGKDMVDTFINHARYNLTSRFGSKMVFYYNRASCQLFDEFETFKDEWCLDDMRSVGKGNGIGEIKIVPSKSYEDYNLFWYAKSFEIAGNQGVYWDNWFIAPTFNTEMTDAYRREDGSVAPAAGIWGMRELCKRTFVMMNEKGMLPVVFPHMTSFNPLPTMAFATVQYDWEWKYSEGDVQDRHTREYILLATTGELSGVWPVPLGDHGPKAEDPWEQRTFSAVRTVHELDGGGGWGLGWIKAHQENKKMIGDAILSMLDKDGLIVYKYWEDRPLPVNTGNPDIPAIVYAVPGKEALVAVVSYVRSDAHVSMTMDANALGLANFAATDAESGEAMKVDGGNISFPLKKHDIRLIRLLAK